MAVNVMKLGAVDLLEKPIDLEELLVRIRTIEQELVVAEEADIVSDRIERDNLPIKIVGSGAAMTNLLSITQRIAPAPWNVLVRGETGTGKELIAKLIHLLSPRSKAPFVEVNCAAIPENLFESELFGHEKGAFTGAANKKRGRFELAHNGSLFLDEIGEMPLNLQAKLLRAIQEKRICRVGAEQDIAVDVRLIAASNRDLKQMVKDGSFREDLYYRLHVLELEIPPLRHRKEDIEELLSYFMEKFSNRPLALSPEAKAIFVKYPFPGNVRELEHMVQRIVTMVRGTVVQASELPEELHHSLDATGNLEERLSSLERQMIIQALARHKGVQTKAAEELGISERVLRYKISKLGLK
jgi:two-component system response regulator AtoC